MPSTDDVPMADAGAGAGELLLVWPWTGVLATTDEGDEAASLLTAHARQHPAAVAATALVQGAGAAPPDTHLNHHFLVLHFGKSLAGLQAAASLADRFAGAGRTEWRQQQQQQDDKSAGLGAVAVYGWTAVEEDLRGEDAVGRFLRATAFTARSAEDAVAGEHERTARLLEARCEEAAAAVRAAEEETSFLRDELAELTAMADKIMAEMNRGVEEENENLKAATKEIELKMEKIALLKEDLEKGTLDISTLDEAGAECKVDGHALMLHENHKREMEAIHAKQTQLEEQLEQREALVFMMRQLNRKLQAGEKLIDTMEDYQRLYTVAFGLDDERERLKASLLDLYNREQVNTKELQENRQELIQGFLENMPISGRVVVGIKRMGQLDERPFQVACKRKYRDDDPDGKVASLVSSWQEEIQKPSWHPFTTIQVDGGDDKEVINDDDPKLRQLQLECGDKVCHAVKATLSELNEYSPHGRHVMNEIWNFREGRKATMTEAITYILEQLTVAGRGLGGREFNVVPKNRSTSV